MSSIDERVVSMKFDNKQFESGVSETLNTLGALSKGLKLQGATKGLQDVNSAAKKVDLSGLASGVETVRVKFSALQVAATTALINITNSAMNAGKNIVKSLAIDPITDGFREYETQMNSVQTILANTSAKGTTLKDVSAALDELNAYADKTIYNFTEMTRNIGTFTAAGVDLQTSTQAIKGISNLAAVSGSNSQQASTAMYQLSQALATGTVKLMDWNSVVNAGMGGQVFQDSLKETARAHGVAIDDIISQEGSFRDSLQTGWLSSEILLETLNKFTGDLNEEQLKSMGYTEAQIADIMKLGQTANDAATKVKTFTQLMDTLKEAVGSGWAQTWKIIFGDFEEAKVLFTSISDVLGGYINKTSEARNSMLSGWKDLGGRTVLIDAFKNAFEGLAQILGTVSSAFKSIFPDVTAQQLFNFTTGLKNLTENFKMSETNLNNLKSTFRGIFAILDICKTAFISVANAFGIVIGGSGNLVSTILSLTGAFGEWLVYIDNTIKQSGVLSTVLNTVANVAKFVMNTISSALNGIGSAISGAFSFSGFEAFNGFLENINKRISSLKDESVSMATVVGGAFLSIGQAIANSKLGQVLTSIWETVTKITSAIGKLVNSMVDSISKSFENASFNGIYDIIGGLSLVAISKTISDFVKNVSNSIEDVKSPLESIKGVLDGVRGTFESYQSNLKAGVLLKIATAIGILAASILTISLIDSGKLASSLAAIGALFTQLIAATFAFTKIGTFKMKVVKASAVLVAMSTSILILSGAMKNLGSMDWNGVAKGMTGIVGLATTLVLASKVLAQIDTKMNVGVTSLIGFSVAIKILASAVNDLSGISWDGLAKGLTGVTVLMGTVSLFLNNTKFSGKSAVAAAGIVILSAGIKILASACKDFGSMSWDSIGKGLVSVGTLLTEIALFTNLTGNAKNVIATGTALVAISAGMKILASAMMDFGSMSWESIAKGLVAMSGALLSIGVALNLMPKNMISMGVGMVAIATSLNILATALVKMGSMSWESIAKGLITLGGSLGILAIGLNAMTGSLAGSAALLVAAGALAILTPSLMALGAMTWDGIIRGLTMLAGTIAIFAGAAALLTPVLPSMLTLATTMAVLGVSLLGMGAGLALAGAGVSALATGFGLLAGITATGAAAIVTSLGIIITGVAALIPAILGKIAEGIVAFCQVFTDSIPAITECISTILQAIIDCIVTNTPIILEGVFTIMNDTLNALIKWVPTVVGKVVELVLAILQVIADNLPKFVTAGVDIIVSFLNGVASNLPRIIQSAFNVIISFINGLANAIRSNSGLIGNACYNLVTAIIQGIGNLNQKFLEAGKYAVEGFIKGLVSMPGKIIEAGKSIGRAALDAAKRALDINSPSKEFFSIGEFSGMGLVNALNGYASKVYDSGYNLGATAISSLKNSISSISDMVTGDLDNTPVISPVMDLSNIQNGIGQLYNMTDNIAPCSIDGSISTSESIARSVNNRSDNAIDNSNASSKSESPKLSGADKGSAVIQLVLQNGKALAEYIIDDVDALMGQKTKISGRRVGI